MCTYPEWETCVWSRTRWRQCLQGWILSPTCRHKQEMLLCLSINLLSVYKQPALYLLNTTLLHITPIAVTSLMFPLTAHWLLRHEDMLFNGSALHVLTRQSDSRKCVRAVTALHCNTCAHSVRHSICSQIIPILFNSEKSENVLAGHLKGNEEPDEMWMKWREEEEVEGAVKEEEWMDNWRRSLTW